MNWTSLSLCLRHCCCDAVYSLSVVASETRFDVDLRLVLTASTATVSVPRRVRPPTTVRDADVVVRRRHRRLDSPSTSRSVWSVTRRHQVVMIDWRGQSVPHLRPATATVKRYSLIIISICHAATRTISRRCCISLKCHKEQCLTPNPRVNAIRVQCRSLLLDVKWSTTE